MVTRDHSPRTHPPGRHYAFAYLGLMALTGLSYGVAQVSLGTLGPVVALTIASVKALVVGLVFMHLARARFATQMIAIVNILFVALICLGIVADVAFR
jgi:cytochrome c oxidase subunit IV